MPAIALGIIFVLVVGYLCWWLFVAKNDKQGVDEFAKYSAETVKEEAKNLSLLVRSMRIVIPVALAVGVGVWLIFVFTHVQY